jgi:hypothetical protein
MRNMVMNLNQNRGSIKKKLSRKVSNQKCDELAFGFVTGRCSIPPISFYPIYYILYDSEGKVVATIASMKSLRLFLEENLSK